MKVVFVNRYYYPDHSATSILLTDLTMYLAAEGYDVHVICSRQLYDSPSAQLTENESVSGVHVHRIWTSRFGRGTILGRVIDYGSFYFSATFRLFSLVDTNSVVVAETDPPLISVIAFGVSRYRGARLVNWLQDIFPEVAAELGFGILRGRIGSWVRRLRNMSLCAADRNVVIGEHMASRIQAYGIQAEKIQIIPNWADGDLITPIPREANPLRTEWEVADKFVVMYSGNMGRAHEFVTILDAAALLRNDGRFVFLFVGNGNQYEPVRGEVKKRNLQNIRFLPYQPSEQLGFSLSVGDVHVISLRPELEGLIVPSKFYGVLAAGRTVLFIGARDGEIARLVNKAGCGVVIEQGDTAGLVSQLTRLADLPSDREQMGKNARRYFDEAVTRTAVFHAWGVLLNSIGRA